MGGCTKATVQDQHQTHEGLNPILQTSKLRFTQENLTRATHTVVDHRSELRTESRASDVTPQAPYQKVS